MKLCYARSLTEVGWVTGALVNSCPYGQVVGIWRVNDSVLKVVWTCITSVLKYLNLGQVLSQGT